MRFKTFTANRDRRGGNYCRFGGFDFWRFRNLSRGRFNWSGNCRRCRFGGSGAGFAYFKRGDQGAFGDFIARFDVYGFDGAGRTGRSIHRRYIRFHHGQGLLYRDHIAGLDQHFDDIDFRDIADVGDFDFNYTHCVSSVISTKERLRQG